MSGDSIPHLETSTPAERQIIDLTFRHALIGTWVYPDDTSVEYTVSALGDVCTITGRDTLDNESFVVSDISWQGQELRFTTLMPSTQYDLRHTFRVISEHEVEHEWTRIERWHKKAPELTVA